MAEGFLRAMAGDRFEVQSAGTEKTAVHPLAIRAMAERDAAYEQCPDFPAKTSRLHWSVSDPAAVAGTEAERLAAFRIVRDDLRRRISEWLADRGLPET